MLNSTRQRNKREEQDDRVLRFSRIILFSLLLTACQSVTVRTPSGATIKSINTGDFGNIAINDATRSAGGLQGLLAGDVSTGRTTAFTETNPGYMRTSVDGVIVEFGGVINNSTNTARHWDGITSSIRNWVSRLVAKDLFDAINTATTESELTDRNSSDNGVLKTQSDNAVLLKREATD